MKPVLQDSYVPLGFDDIRRIWSRSEKPGGSQPCSQPCPPVIDYREVQEAADINEVFGVSDVSPGDSVIIYYPHTLRESSTYGHYVAMCYNNDRIQYCDSYGKLPDEIVARGDQYFYRDRAKQLLRHIGDAGMSVDFSEYRHQNTAPGVATCGRHALHRCFFSGIGNDDYARVLARQAAAQGLCPDDYVAKRWHS